MTDISVKISKNVCLKEEIHDKSDRNCLKTTTQAGKNRSRWENLEAE